MTNTTSPASSSNRKGSAQACLFVAHFGDETSQETLCDFFSSYGEVLSITQHTDRASRPYAFVQFLNVDDANVALSTAHGSELNDCRLRVEKARVNRTLFIAKLSKKTTNTELREMAETYGDVESVSIIKNHQTNRSKGCGFVKYVYREDAQEAFTELKNVHDGLVVEWATSTNDPDLLGIDKCNVFVGGLNPQQIHEEALLKYFERYGAVESCTLVNRYAGEQDIKGIQRSAFAFIRYTDKAAAASAIENENGADWLERRIRVQYCESQEMKEKRRVNKYYQYAQTPNNLHYAPGMSLPPSNMPMMNPNGVSYYPSPMSMYSAENMPGAAGYGAAHPYMYSHMPWTPMYHPNPANHGGTEFMYEPSAVHYQGVNEASNKEGGW